MPPGFNTATAWSERTTRLYQQATELCAKHFQPSRLDRDYDGYVSTGHDDVLDTIERAVTGRGVRGVAGAIAALIRAGSLPEGTRLPPVRRLADHLGVSPTTVAGAWSQLASLGLITSRGRQGTFVASSTIARPRRWRTQVAPALRYDLGTGAPDPQLLPDPRPYLARLEHLEPATYADPPVFEPLVDVLAEVLEPELGLGRGRALTIVDGALEAIDRLLDTLPSSTRSVAVEDPSFPALFDLVEAHGFAVVRIPLDAEGPDPTAVARAAAQPDLGALIFQPRAHNPTGIALTPQRRNELALALTRRPDVLVIEDDHSGLLARAPLATLTTAHPRCATVVSFSKSHGPDLRLAAVIGDADRIANVEQARSLGPSWSSKLLQALLAAMLRDPADRDRLQLAQLRYDERRSQLAEIVGAACPGEGINAWALVAEEPDFTARLAHQGVRVIPASTFTYDRSASHHVRITLAEPRYGFAEALEYLAALVRDPAPSLVRDRALGR